jgi:hypothetical protein
MSSISEVVYAHVDKILNEIHTTFPGKVLRYDHERQVADIQPTLKKKFKDGTVLDFPVLHDVPLLFYSSSDCIIAIPINTNDTVLVCVCERSLDAWLHSDSEAIDSEDTRKFHLSDAVAFPALRAEKQRVAFKKDSLTLKHGKKVIEICKEHINIFTDSSLNLNSSDKVVIESAKTIEIKSNNTINIQCSEANIKASSVIIDAKISKFNGNIECKNIICNDVSALNGTISLAKHIHTGVLPGGSATTPPTPTG